MEQQLLLCPCAEERGTGCQPGPARIFSGVLPDQVQVCRDAYGIPFNISMAHAEIGFRKSFNALAGVFVGPARKGCLRSRLLAIPFAGIWVGALANVFMLCSRNPVRQPECQLSDPAALSAQCCTPWVSRRVFGMPSNAQNRADGTANGRSASAHRRYLCRLQMGNSLIPAGNN